MTVRIWRGAGLGFVLAVGVTLSACSYPPPGSESAAQVIPGVQAATVSATSVHVAGSLAKGTQLTTMDVRIYGNSVAGTLGAYGTRFYVLSLDGTSFVKLNAAFLRQEDAPASLCARICGKYVELSVSSTSEIIGLLSMQQLVSDVFNTKNMTSAAGSGCVFSPTTLGGESVLQCRQGGYTLDVAAQGTPYLVYWSGPHGQHLTFSDWNSVPPPVAPPASQVVSLSDLG